jgi:hypothetical protein
MIEIGKQRRVVLLLELPSRSFVAEVAQKNDLLPR